MGDIFVSYRRDDSQWSAGRLNDRIEAAFGAERVFFDTVAILPGEDFHQVLGEKVGRCKVLLAVIGPDWLQMMERRSTIKADFVRIEIAAALEKGVLVIPVLIDGAKPPEEDRLPDDLRLLARRHAVAIRAETFRSDADQLIAFLSSCIGVSDSRFPKHHAAIRVNAEFTHGVDGNQFVPGRGGSEWFRDLATGPELVIVPPGEIEVGHGDRKKLLQQASPIAVGRFACTFDEWDAAVSPGGVLEARSDFGWGRGRRPVVGVSWHDAKTFGDSLSHKTGHRYQLLSEDEWEYCCRANAKTAFTWGDTITTQQARFSEENRGSAGKTAEVGSYPPNAWGLYDMHGNVWEWCEDAEGIARVVRGGSWFNPSSQLRASYRDWALPAASDYTVGFRLKRSL